MGGCLSTYGSAIPTSSRHFAGPDRFHEAEMREPEAKCPPPRAGSREPRAKNLSYLYLGSDTIRVEISKPGAGRKGTV